MSKTLLLVAALCAVVVAAIGATSAFAGEITGNGTPKWTNTDRWTDPAPATPCPTLERQLAMRVLGPGRQPVPGNG